MEDQQLLQLQYPIGKFTEPKNTDQAFIESAIADIASFPQSLSDAVANLSEQQLDTPYRTGGWTVRQVVHHCADSHMNSWIRFKLALTEDKPVIRPYFEDRWAGLPDSRVMSIEPALLLLSALHTKWVFLLKSLNETDLRRTYVHPEQGREYRLDVVIVLYAWHCNHHLAHVTGLKARMGWE
jgi:hypothetical protein